MHKTKDSQITKDYKEMVNRFSETLSAEFEEYFKIKDNCRKELLIYLFDALNEIEVPKNSRILDIGCGTGVPTLALAYRYHGKIKAIDININSLSYFKKKIRNSGYDNRIELVNTSLFELPTDETYDLVLAEGVLNVVGFEKGLRALVKVGRKEGFIIIHDEKKSLHEKAMLFEQNNCKIIDSIFLSEEIWWNNYYKHLKKQYSQIKDTVLLKLFKPDINEIHAFKKNPLLFQSVYYVLKIQ